MDLPAAIHGAFDDGLLPHGRLRKGYVHMIHSLHASQYTSASGYLPHLPASYTLLRHHIHINLPLSMTSMHLTAFGYRGDTCKGPVEDMQLRQETIARGYLISYCRVQENAVGW